uniref:Uncharacterized protein n=1 Tax=Musa acuminata subsp. malaccensis TaxID=214687 RepID=A0A804IJ79_MUSAM
MKRSLRLPFSFLILVAVFSVLSFRAAVQDGRRRERRPEVAPPANATLLRLAAVESGEAELRKDVDDLLDGTFPSGHRGPRFPHRLRGPKDYRALPDFRRPLRDWFRPPPVPSRGHVGAGRAHQTPHRSPPRPPRHQNRAVRLLRRGRQKRDPPEQRPRRPDRRPRPGDPPQQRSRQRVQPQGRIKDRPFLRQQQHPPPLRSKAGLLLSSVRRERPHRGDAGLGDLRPSQRLWLREVGGGEAPLPHEPEGGAGLA